MHSTGIIGWASPAACGLAFAALYVFITRPSRRLEKLLGDGVRLALCRLDQKSDERVLLRAAGELRTVGQVRGFLAMAEGVETALRLG
jgi:hypothetical protein